MNIAFFFSYDWERSDFVISKGEMPWGEIATLQKSRGIFGMDFVQDNIFQHFFWDVW